MPYSRVFLLLIFISSLYSCGSPSKTVVINDLNSVVGIYREASCPNPEDLLASVVDRFIWRGYWSRTGCTSEVYLDTLGTKEFRVRCIDYNSWPKNCPVVYEISLYVLKDLDYQDRYYIVSRPFGYMACPNRYRTGLVVNGVDNFSTSLVGLARRSFESCRVPGQKVYPKYNSNMLVSGGYHD